MDRVKEWAVRLVASVFLGGAPVGMMFMVGQSFHRLHGIGEIILYSWFLFVFLVIAIAGIVYPWTWDLTYGVTPLRHE